MERRSFRYNFVDAIFMDLSKAFDKLNHDLPIAKFEACVLSINYFRHIYSYLNQHLQRTGVNNSFSLWKDIIAGVPQGSMIGPLLFNPNLGGREVILSPPVGFPLITQKR